MDHIQHLIKDKKLKKIIELHELEYWVIKFFNDAVPNSSVLQDGETKNLQLPGFSPFVL